MKIMNHKGPKCKPCGTPKQKIEQIIEWTQSTGLVLLFDIFSEIGVLLDLSFCM